ncbi:MAG: CHAT domain-containing protein [Candidatus Solibacter usitatus]|nr:CHAT domain-containing protein [Candidatus Solibacter usitatus]
MTFIGRGAPVRGHHIIRLAALTLCLLAPAAGPEAQRLNKLGADLLYRGDYDRALESFERSRLLHHQEGEFRFEAERWVNIGAIHFYRGRYLEAWTVYDRAAGLASAHSAEPWSAGVLQLVEVNRAALLQKLGRDQDALDLYTRLRRAGALPDDAERAQMLSNLGALYRRLGDPYKALESEQSALDIFRRRRDVDGQLGAMKNMAIARAMDFGDLKAAARLFSEVLSMAQAASNRREVMQARLYLGETLFRAGDRAGAAREWTQALLLSQALQAPEEQWKALYGLGRARLSYALFRQAAEVIESSRAGLGLSPLRGGFLAGKRDVYDALIEGAPGVDSRLDWLERSRGHSGVRLDRLRALLPRDAALLVYWLGRSKAAVLCITPAGASWVELPKGVWLPDLPLPPRLIVVPDGSLAAAAFDALTLPDGRNVVERHQTWQLPSTAYLRAPTQSRPRRWPWQRQLLGVGDPQVRTVLPGDENWTRLPRAAAELETVARLLPGRADLFKGSQAGKDRLQSASAYPVLHLATHAAADYENPARSRILFAGPEYLFLRDVAGLDLHGVELVTLSACQTEAGAPARGDAPLSLGRAFLQAGAGSVVGTLWAVRDQAAATMMHRFYRELSGGAAPAAALRTAKLAMLRSGAPRQDWAAFVLSGDGGAPLTPYFSWSFLLCCAAAAAATLAIAADRLRRRRSRAAARSLPRSPATPRTPSPE